VKIFRPSTTSCRPSSLLYPNSASAKMPIPNKHPAANFSRLSTSEETVYISPASLSEPFPAPSYKAGPVDMGPGGIEMRQTFVRQNTNPSFPGQARQYTLTPTEESADNANSFRDPILSSRSCSQNRYFLHLERVSTIQRQYWEAIEAYFGGWLSAMGDHSGNVYLLCGSNPYLEAQTCAE
jgi:hypothetical protein